MPSLKQPRQMANCRDTHCARCERLTPSRVVIQLLPGSRARMLVTRCTFCNLAKSAEPHGDQSRERKWDDEVAIR